MGGGAYRGSEAVDDWENIPHPDAHEQNELRDTPVPDSVQGDAHVEVVREVQTTSTQTNAIIRDPHEGEPPLLTSSTRSTRRKLVFMLLMTLAAVTAVAVVGSLAGLSFHHRNLNSLSKRRKPPPGYTSLRRRRWLTLNRFLNSLPKRRRTPPGYDNSRRRRRLAPNRILELNSNTNCMLGTLGVKLD